MIKENKYTNNENGAVIKKDIDVSLGFESNSFFKEIVNFFLIPILNIIPASFQKVVKKTHKSAEEVIDNATTHKALEVLYHKGNPSKSKHLLHKFFHSVWFNTNNSKAVRNRLLIVKRELLKSITDTLKAKKEMKLLSIASGSARAVLEAVFELNIPSGDNIRLTFLDKNPKAIEYSKELTEELGLVDKYKLGWITDTVSSFPNHLNEKQDIIEMVGLLDYFDDERVLKTFSLIYNNLNEGGVFITANIDHNREKRFVTNVVGWSMIYRDAKTLIRLATEAGFKAENIIAYYEPLGIHSVLVAKK